MKVSVIIIIIIITIWAHRCRRLMLHVWDKLYGIFARLPVLEYMFWWFKEKKKKTRLAPMHRELPFKNKRLLFSPY